jgi:hypothetical protein
MDSRDKLSTVSSQRYAEGGGMRRSLDELNSGKGLSLRNARESIGVEGHHLCITALQRPLASFTHVLFGGASVLPRTNEMKSRLRPLRAVACLVLAIYVLLTPRLSLSLDSLVSYRCLSPTALASTKDGQTLFIACGTASCVLRNSRDAVKDE